MSDTDSIDAGKIVTRQNEVLTLSMSRREWVELHSHLNDGGNFFGATIRRTFDRVGELTTSPGGEAPSVTEAMVEAAKMAFQACGSPSCEDCSYTEACDKCFTSEIRAALTAALSGSRGTPHPDTLERFTDTRRLSFLEECAVSWEEAPGVNAYYLSTNLRGLTFREAIDAASEGSK